MCGEALVTPFEDCAGEIFALSYRVAYRLTGSRADAEDVAQDICARAYLRWSRVSPYAQAWAARCAANLALDVLRRRSRSRASDHPPTVSVDADRVDLVRALEQLSAVSVT